MVLEDIYNFPYSLLIDTKLFIKNYLISDLLDALVINTWYISRTERILPTNTGMQ